MNIIYPDGEAVTRVNCGFGNRQDHHGLMANTGAGHV